MGIRFCLTTSDIRMPKTPKQEIDDKLEALQLELIKENSIIEGLTPVTIPDFMGDNRKRDDERRMHEAIRDSITRQIAFLTRKKAQANSGTAKKPPSKSTKQASVYKEIVRIKKRNPRLTNEEAIGLLADKWDDSEEAIRKAFYAEQKRLHDEKGPPAGKQGDSENDSDERDRNDK